MTRLAQELGDVAPLLDESVRFARPRSRCLDDGFWLGLGGRASLGDGCCMTGRGRRTGRRDLGVAASRLTATGSRSTAAAFHARDQRTPFLFFTQPERAGRQARCRMNGRETAFDDAARHGILDDGFDDFVPDGAENSFAMLLELLLSNGRHGGCGFENRDLFGLRTVVPAWSLAFKVVFLNKGDFIVFDFFGNRLVVDAGLRAVHMNEK